MSNYQKIMPGNSATSRLVSVPRWGELLRGTKAASATRTPGCGPCAVCVWEPCTFHILHDHAQVASCFKGAIHADHEGVLRESEDVTFHEGLLDLVPKDEVLFIDLLHGKPLPGFFMPNKVDRPEMEYRETEDKDAQGMHKPHKPHASGVYNSSN